ncbi:MAG: efflux RND transporter periplasmic adaptor subunit [Candidatus Acidiferrales bacterium]
MNMPPGPVRACRTCLPLLLGITCCLLAGCGSSAKPVDDAAHAPVAPVVTAHRENLTSRLSIAAEFQPYQEVNVYAKVSGYIQKLYVDWGAHVKQGQLLAVLEIPELQQQLEQDEANTRKSEQDLERAKEELHRATSAYTVAHLTYSRLADVQKSRPELVAQEEIDIAQGKDQEASAGESSAKDALAGSEQELAASKAAMEKDRALFGYSRITAPFDGVVTEIGAYTGALLPAGTSSNKGDQTLCHLSQNNLLRLVIPVPERAVADLHVAEPVTVTVSSIHRTFSGKVSLFSDQIDEQTRTMHTEVEVPNPAYEIVPGMYATVEIPLHTVPNALTVPVQAVQTSGETSGAVLVVGTDNRIEKRDVTIGVQSATDVEILTGLRENERVIFGEQSQYKPGELVNPKPITPSEAE